MPTGIYDRRVSKRPAPRARLAPRSKWTCDHARIEENTNAKGGCLLCQRARGLRHYRTDRGRAAQREFQRGPKGVAAKKRYGWKVYGIVDFTMADYDSLLNRQGGVCPLCGEPPRAGKSFDVDHDHATGAVRGLLHDVCNRLLGRYEAGRRPRRVTAFSFLCATYIYQHARASEGRAA